MEINLDTQSRDVLENTFRCCDFDGDGQISKQDLMLTCGFVNIQDADQMFYSLKEAGGSDNFEANLTFEEFFKGIMDFPDILEQFSLSDEGTQEDQQFDTIFETRESCGYEESYSDVLRQCLQYFQNALDSFDQDRDSAPQPDSFSNLSNQEVLDGINYALKMIQNKAQRSKQSEWQSPIVQLAKGGKAALKQIQTMHASYRQEIEKLLLELQEERQSLQNTFKRMEALEQNNNAMVEKLGQLEQENFKTQQAHYRAVEEKQKLEQSLEQVSVAEEEAVQTIQSVQVNIRQKEIEIENLEKEVRRLRSFKAVQQMRGDGGNINPNEFQKKKIERKNKPRGSVPMGLRVQQESPRNSIRISHFEKNLMSQITKLNIQNSELRELLDEQEKKYRMEVDRLLRENHNIKTQLYQNDLLKETGSIETEEQGISFQEELNLLTESYRPSVQQPQPKPTEKRMLDKGCQVNLLPPEQKKSKPDIDKKCEERPRRGCCGWF